MTIFDIRLFGAIEIRRDGVLLTDFRSQKALVLLAYLICANRPVTRDYLAGLAWPEMEQSQALGLLRRSLHDLNSQLPDCLAIERRTVGFSSSAPATVDIHILAHWLARHDEDKEDIAAAAAVAALYHAPFLHGVYVDEAPELESWLAREQEQWQQAATRLLQRLIQHHTAAAAYALALRYAQQLLTLEPWREEVQRQAMLLLARSGQVSAALTQYATCRQILQKELDVEPDEETEILYARIKAMVQTLPANLPPATTRFIGREEELAQLTHLLAEPACRLVTIIAAGGMGKTRLALEVARHLTSQAHHTFLHGVAFAALASVDTYEQLVAALTQALAFPLQTQGAREMQLLAYLKDKELLLLLDNFEHLNNPRTVAFILKLMQTAPDVKLLITARTRLNLQGEQLYWMQGLHFPLTAATTSTDEIKRYSAFQLFIASAQRANANYRLRPDDVPALLAICQLVQGMPLALELAAPWTSVLSLAEIAAQIARDLDFLATEAQDLPLRQRSMRAVFHTSWRLLSANEQRVLQQLSLFRGGFTRQLATEVADATPALLLKLLDQSLINGSPQTRYMLHELIRQFAAEQLEQAGRLRETAQRHARAVLRYVNQFDPETRYQDSERWLQAILAEYDNIQAALQWCFATTQAELGLEIVVTLGDFWYRHGDWQAGRTWLARALTITPTLARPALRAAALNELGVLLLRMDEPEAAWQSHVESLQIFRQLGDEREIAWTCYHMASKAFYQGEYAPAQTAATESLTLFRQLGHPRGSAAALARLATLWLEGDRDWVRAEPLLIESLAIARQINERRLIDGALIMLGQVAEQQGDLVRAEAYLTESLSGLPSKEGKSWALGILGRVFLAGGKADQADYCFQESLQLRQELGDREAIAWMLEALADVALFRQEFAQAAFLLGVAHSLRLISHAEKSGNEAVVFANTVAEIKSQLGEAQFTTAWHKGVQLAKHRIDFTNLT